MAGHRETFLREQGQVCSSLCVALQEGGDICLVLGGGDLESVGHGCLGETGQCAVRRLACGGKSLVDRKEIDESEKLCSFVARSLPRNKG